jgi:hypothetical protein
MSTGSIGMLGGHVGYRRFLGLQESRQSMWRRLAMDRPAAAAGRQVIRLDQPSAGLLRGRNRLETGRQRDIP